MAVGLQTHWSCAQMNNLAVNSYCFTVLKFSDHGGCETLKEKIRNCRPREKSGFENPENPDFDRIRFYVLETDLDRRAIVFCVEKW